MTSALLALPADVVIVPASRRPASREPATVYLSRLAPGSRPAIASALHLIARTLSSGACDATTLPWEQLRYQHSAALRAWLADRYRPATVNRHLAALRGVLREAWQLGLLAGDDYQRALAVRSVRAATLPRGRALTRGELRALFEACAADDSPAGARDAALLAVLYGSGLRRAEAVALEVDDYDGEPGAIRVRSGKGRKDRLTYVPAGGRRALAVWLAARGTSEGPLFLPINKGGAISSRRMSGQAVADACAKRSAEARIRAFTPHDLRRSFVSDLLDAGADIATVQRLAGHAQVTTTGRYDRRGEEVKRQAAELLHVPYGARQSA